MSENLILKSSDITYAPAPVTFNSYGICKAMAEEIAKYISSTALTEDNVTDVKAMLANARRLTKELNDRRIAIEKEVLVNYRDMKTQVDEIISIVDSADRELRAKVTDMENAEREKKREQLRTIWNQRIGFYRINDYGDFFDTWCAPCYLNKSMTIKKAEAEMTDWLEEVERDLAFLDRYDPDYAVTYLDCFDVKKTIEIMEKREEMREAVTAAKDEPMARFVISGRANIELMKRLLTENDIKFILEV